MSNQFENYKDPDFGGIYNGKLSSSQCAIEGFCSVDPIVYSLLEVLLYELKQLTYYYVKMQELGYENCKLKDRIISYLSLIIVGYEFDRNEFQKALSEIHRDKEEAKNSFIKVCEQKNIDCQILKSNIKFEKFDLNSLVNQGEQQAINRNKSVNSDTKNLYEIIMNIIKSASIRLIELKSYTKDYLPEEDSILKLFNNLNFSSMTESKLTRKINDFAIYWLGHSNAIIEIRFCKSKL